MAILPTPYTLKGLELKNRIVMAPMCQYSVHTEDGMPNDWHYVHYVSRAVGGTGLILMEMTDVDPDGRITNDDLGLWSDDHIPAYKRIVDEVHKYGSKIGIQIAHAGRKAEDADQPVGPSNIPASALPGETKNGVLKQPRELTVSEIKQIVNQFKEAASRAVQAGFDTIELHGAHGYLIHQFMSPSSNKRTDEYGENLAKFGIEVIQAVKSVMPQEMPLIMRVSAIEYVDDGYGIHHCIDLAKQFKEVGVDIFHVSSGGEGVPGKLKPGTHAGYQVPFARKFKEELNMPVIAVGNLNDPQVAEEALANGDADLVAVGRGMLNDPYWALHAIKAVSGTVTPPSQYARGIR